MNVDGSGCEVVVCGICNMVGFVWYFDLGELWFIDNGCDMMGDDVFDDKLNCVFCVGFDFGFFYCYGGDMFDFEFGSVDVCCCYVLFVLKFGVYVVVFGMCFYIGLMFLVLYCNNVFIVEYGLWNCSMKVGYCVMCVVVLVDGSYVC